jgi:two-component SAPR family response regulator
VTASEAHGSVIRAEGGHDPSAQRHSVRRRTSGCKFADPEKALSPLEAVDPPDVVITDVDLGCKLNGFAVAATVRDRWPAVHVLLISGLPPDHTGQRLDPRDRYLQKPISSRRLLRTIDELARAA